jgi:hypothetical protein
MYLQMPNRPNPNPATEQALNAIDTLVKTPHGYFRDSNAVYMEQWLKDSLDVLSKLSGAELVAYMVSNQRYRAKE